MSEQVGLDLTPTDFELIVTIVNSGAAEKVMDATHDAGAKGGTVMLGRGVGRERRSLLGVPVEHEKEIVLTVVADEQRDEVLGAIQDTIDLEKPGRGIAFVVDLEEVAGLAHLLGEAGDGGD